MSEQLSDPSVEQFNPSIINEQSQASRTSLMFRRAASTVVAFGLASSLNVSAEATINQDERTDETNTAISTVNDVTSNEQTRFKAGLSNSGGFILASHRGSVNGRNRDSTENGILGYKAVSRMGRDVCFETDVRFTRDGVPVLMHDDNVAKTTNGRGNVSSMPYAKFRRLKLDLGRRESAPTFERLARLASRTGNCLLPEIKDERPTLAELKKVNDIIIRYGLEDRTAVQSFSLRNLRKWNSVSSIDSGYLKMSAPDSSAFYSGLSTSGIDWILAHSISGSAVRTAKAAGLDVGVWTIDNPEQFARVKNRGVDMIISDNPRANLAQSRGSSY